MSDAVRERHAGTATAGDTDRIHAAAEEESASLGRFAEHECSVRRETLRSIQQHASLGGLEHGQAMQRLGHHRLEVLPILGQELEREILAEAGGIDRLSHWLEA